MNPLELPAKVEDLERRLAAIEGQSPSPVADQLTPNVFVINPDGTISEKLSGELEAKGLIFEEAQPLIEPIHSEITWLRSGVLAEQITGQRDHTGEPTLAFVTTTIGGSPGSGLVLGGTSGSTFAKAIAGAHTSTVINSAGSSSFLQLAGILGAAQGRSQFLQLANVLGLSLNVGISEVEWPGGTNVSLQTRIFGLPGGASFFYFATAIKTAGVGPSYMQVGPASSTEVYFEAIEPFGFPVAGVKCNFYWLALNG